ncbi:exopolysaccharide Pel transporter PelG [Ferrigenium sp. UT5]|uniref:exopolysaccharide Pel transporter PelG n=1 Tax=Ferrigenium sp. UT5 TaxID=3242105 RepID=UPI00354BF42C
MAGIGFELRKLLEKDSYFGLFQAYAYAGIISSGPWVLSIIGILFVGFLSLGVVFPHAAIVQFQVSVTYLIMSSLILTGFIQLGFTRFIADSLFSKKDEIVLPNFAAVLLLVTSVSGMFGMLLLHLFFGSTSLSYRMLMVSGFVILCAIWVATIFLSGMKQYKEIVLMFAAGYAVTVLCALLLRTEGMEGLLLGFVVGHVVLLFGMITLILREFPLNIRTFSFDFMRPGAMYVSLLWSGFLYNLAVWADKLIFWFHPDTSQAIIGPLRASLIYDFPIFLAYLEIIPGMAVFLVRIETDFVEYYDKFYEAVREGGSLDHIMNMRDNMLFTVRQGLFEIVKIQAIAVLLVFVLGAKLLTWLGISTLYLPLLYVDVVAVGLQVVLLGVLNIFFYLDKRHIVVFLCALFLISNVALTALSIYLGASFYGYGFALSLLITVLAGMHLLSRKLDLLEYETFMLQ